MKRECAARGTKAVIAGCVALLRGSEADAQLIYALGGPPARWAVTGGESGPDYWLRVWAARGLLYAYDASAGPAVIEALGDEQSALPLLANLAGDSQLRVRRAAERAVIRIMDGN